MTSILGEIEPTEEIETPEVVEETTDTDEGERPPTVFGEDGMNPDQFVNFLGADKETPPKPEAEPLNEEEAAEQANEKWYKEAFKGETEDSPAETAEMNGEMYKVSGTIGAEITDEFLPTFISKLHGKNNDAEYKATDKQKTNLARAWELYLRWKKKSLSPLSYLMFQIFVVYGINFIGGLFAYIERIRTYGFHWFWSDSWKEKAARKAEDDFEDVETHAKPTRAEPQKEPLKAVHGEVKQCLYSGEHFEAGKGFPSKSKEFPDLIDAFVNRSAWLSYLNANDLRGGQKRKKAKK